MLYTKSFVKESHSTIQELTLRYNLSVVCRDFTIGYENLTLQQISHLVLPQNQSLTGFSQIGHIAHFNLRTDSLPYKSLIGEVVLEKVPTVRTVVNKIENVSTEFRNFSFEILAGERNTVAQVVEHGVKFGLDFAKVYWNTRLSSEHQRIVQMLSKDSVLIDAFCGVGPFAIPALKKGCKVYANDLNPDSVEWLSKNVKLNKLSDQNIRVFNLDASDFFTAALTEIFGPGNKTKNELLDSNNSETYHITMNLPALAYTFLERFKNAMHEIQRPKNAKIFLHVYCFVSKTGSKMEAIKLTFDSLNLSSLSIENFASGCNVHDVRQVSANKSMVCVSFDVNSLLFKDTSADASADNCELNPCSKRPKLESFT